jgi:hypothetical protein
MQDSLAQINCYLRQHSFISDGNRMNDTHGHISPDLLKQQRYILPLF